MAFRPRQSASEFAKEFTFFRGWALLALVMLLVTLLLAAPALASDTASHGEETGSDLPVHASYEVSNAALGCLNCHGQEYLGSVQVGDQRKDLYISTDAYAESAHAMLPCNSCHIGFSHDNPHQMVVNAEFFAETASEACRNCHDDQYEMFKQSYHGTLGSGGVKDGLRAPGCVDCHGNHQVREVSTLEYRQEIQAICGDCHGGRTDSYLDTYHGKAVKLGREASATCVDCHGDHSILPVGNPESTLSKANILATCQECHPKATEGFTTFLVHIEPTSTDAPLIVFAVAWFYLLLIIAVFTWGGVHTLLYIYRGFRDGLYFKGGH
jgi:hypothetical protein